MICVQDEAIVTAEARLRKGVYTPRGVRAACTYTGTHSKTLPCGFGKAVLICDRAPQHRSKLVKEFLRNNRNVKIMYFPRGSPYLNAVEECWRQGKCGLLVSEYYRTFSDMCRAVSTYYRTARFHLELTNYVNKKTVLLHTNL